MMQEVQDIFNLAFGYMVYIVPTILVFSIVSFADHIYEFLLKMVRTIRKGYKLG